MKKISKVYDKICDFLSIKKITWMTLAVFLLMLLPIFYLSFINRATGDDYGYSLYTKTAWLSSYSIIEVIKAIWKTIKQFYVGWQGTWFTIFLFTLQPEAFHEKGYVLVAFFMLFIWCGSTILLIKELLGKKLQFDKWSVSLVTILFLVIAISFVPRKQPAIFWWTGASHYTIPFSMCQMVVYWLLKYSEEYKIRYFVGITAFMACLGGANYQAALFALIVTVYFVIADFVLKKDKKTFLLFIPIILEAIGLVISIKAPGNKVRGGEEFGFSVGKVIGTIVMSFVGGVKDAISYLQESPMIYVFLIMIFFVVLHAVKVRGNAVSIKYSFILLLSVFCLYSAMQAPAIFAAVEVSGGVYNTNFLVFLMLMMALIVIVAEKVGVWISKNHSKIWEKHYSRMVMPGFVICMFMLLICRSDIKETTTWQCYDYIATGQAMDYKAQMDEFIELLSDDSAQEVVLPSINDQQGPLQHMSVTSNPEAWTNTTVSSYFGKKSVVAIPRAEWEEKYNKE